MNPKKIDTQKTENVTGDKQTYGDASDLDVTHYLGNNENIPREEKEEEEDQDIGKIAYGNVKSSDEQRDSL